MDIFGLHYFFKTWKAKRKNTQAFYFGGNKQYLITKYRITKKYENNMRFWMDKLPREWINFPEDGLKAPRVDKNSPLCFKISLVYYRSVKIQHICNTN